MNPQRVQEPHVHSIILYIISGSCDTQLNLTLDDIEFVT